MEEAGQAAYVVERSRDRNEARTRRSVGPKKIPMQVLDDHGPYGSTQIQAARAAATDYLGKGAIRYLGKGIDGDPDSIGGAYEPKRGRAAHWSRPSLIFS